MAIPLQIAAPDLYPSALQVNGSAVADQPVEIEWSITNQGDGPTQAGHDWYDQLYLSEDAAWDSGDTQIWQDHNTGPLLAGASYLRTNMVTMPRVAPGMYYLIVITDRDYSGAQNIFEGNETNNTLVRLLESVIKMDVEVIDNTTSIQWPNTIDEWHFMESTNLLIQNWEKSLLLPIITNETQRITLPENTISPIFFRLNKSF